ncbi:Histone H2A.Z-specific chaperone CHZ1 [Neurospora sp. IMI 360204]|nr:Histone H2A.Z-specific chaperone CHZ1 [Neurospora sp. IMI 360204]
MSTENGTTDATLAGTAEANTTFESKGKGKAPAESEDHPMGEAEDDEDDEDEDEAEEPEAEDDNLEEIDPSNVISGPRTRQKEIDYAKAAQDLPAEEDDEEDDEEFVPEDEEMEE